MDTQVEVRTWDDARAVLVRVGEFALAHEGLIDRDPRSQRGLGTDDEVRVGLQMAEDDLTIRAREGGPGNESDEIKALRGMYGTDNHQTYDLLTPEAGEPAEAYADRAIEVLRLDWGFNRRCPLPEPAQMYVHATISDDPL